MRHGLRTVRAAEIEPVARRRRLVDRSPIRTARGSIAPERRCAYGDRCLIERGARYGGGYPRDCACLGPEVLALESPGKHAPGGDAEHLWVEPRAEGGAAGQQHLGLAADLDTADAPGVGGGDVVDDQCHSLVVADVPELLALGEVVAADVDGLQLRLYR